MADLLFLFSGVFSVEHANKEDTPWPSMANACYYGARIDDDDDGKRRKQKTQENKKKEKSQRVEEYEKRGSRGRVDDLGEAGTGFFVSSNPSL